MVTKPATTTAATATTTAATTTPEVDNTTDSQLNTTVADLSTPTSTPTLTPTRPDSTSSSSTDITGTDNTGGGPSPAVVGGAIGGVVAVVIIVVLVVVFLSIKRRRSKKKKKDSPWMPAVTDLENIERKRTGNGTPNQPHYDNLDIHGNPNERTDPALDEEGYLKKTKKHGKKQKNKGKSLPRHPAPPAPKQAGQSDGMEEYENVEAKVQIKSESEKKIKSKPNAAKAAPNKEPGYVNSGHHMFSASAKSEQEYVNIDSKDMGQSRNYANVSGTGSNKVPEDSSEELYENPES